MRETRTELARWKVTFKLQLSCPDCGSVRAGLLPKKVWNHFKFASAHSVVTETFLEGPRTCHICTLFSPVLLIAAGKNSSWFSNSRPGCLIIWESWQMGRDVVDTHRTEWLLVPYREMVILCRCICFQNDCSHESHATVGTIINRWDGAATSDNFIMGSSIIAPRLDVPLHICERKH